MAPLPLPYFSWKCWKGNDALDLVVYSNFFYALMLGERWLQEYHRLIREWSDNVRECTVRRRTSTELGGSDCGTAQAHHCTGGRPWEGRKRSRWIQDSHRSGPYKKLLRSGLSLLMFILLRKKPNPDFFTFFPVMVWFCFYSENNTFSVAFKSVA